VRAFNNLPSLNRPSVPLSPRTRSASPLSRSLSLSRHPTHSAVDLPLVPASVAGGVASALGPCIASGALSKLQLEGVLHACAKHEILLPGGMRAGFLLGDGAGVGKGRQVAAVALVNLDRVQRVRAAGSAHHPARGIWVSVSRDLKADAERDVQALCPPSTSGQGTLFGSGGGGAGGRSSVTIFNGPDEGDKAGRRADGILFLTYTTLARKGRGSKPSRLEQVVRWAAAASPTGTPDGFDGCLIFDESHKAKTFKGGGDGEGTGGTGTTAVAQAVVSLQIQLPKARVVYGKRSG